MLQNERVTFLFTVSELLRENHKRSKITTPPILRLTSTILGNEKVLGKLQKLGIGTA